MNRIRKYWHALGMLLWLPAAAGAHVGERLYPVSYLSDEMLAEVRMDGFIDEWQELLGEPAMTSLDFLRIGEEEPPDPGTLDFRVWLGWHDDPARFYLAFLASDDVYKNTHDWSVDSRAYVGFHDSIELAVDGDHSGGRRCSGNCSEEEGLELPGQTQRYGAIARTASGPAMRGAFAWMAMPPYGEAGGSVAGEAPFISVIELYVTPFDWLGAWDNPEESAVSDLTAGQVIGFTIVVHDYDPPQEHSEEKALLPEGVELKDVLFREGDGLLDGILLPIEPDGTAVEGSTWGRIKASLTLE